MSDLWTAAAAEEQRRQAEQQAAEPATPPEIPDGSAGDRAPRRELDRYYTPDDVATALVSLLDIREDQVVVEPSVGGGAFARAILAQQPRAYLIGVDVDPDARGLALCQRAYGGADWLGYGPEFRLSGVEADWVVGNPPYKHAQEHATHALRSAPFVAMLLRLAFIESATRWSGFWADERVQAWAQLADVYVLANRVSFTGRGVDNAAYGWFVWRRGHTGPPRLHLARLEAGRAELAPVAS